MTVSEPPPHRDVPPLDQVPSHQGLGWPPGSEPASPGSTSRAAQERATEEHGAPEGQAPPRTQARVRNAAASATVALLIGLLAFALVVQVQSNVGDTQLENARQDDLVRILSDLNAREQRLRSDITTLQVTLAQLGEGAQGRDAALAEARRRADDLGILAGTLAAQGEGLILRLVPKDSAIRSSTVLEAVEELRGAGAEAMQIAGRTGPAVRIVASTYFGSGPGGLIVDGTAIPAPYTLTVIGPAATMKTALMIPGGVADSVAREGGTLLVDEANQVVVDALHRPENLEYAKPVE